MEAHQFLLALLIILVSARIFGELAAAIVAPPVIGELVAGIVIGPSLFGWVENHELIHLFAEVGVILLLFQVGMETDVEKLISAGKESTIVALGGFFAPLIAGFCLAYYLFDLPYLVALFIGGTLTATSIGVTVRALTDLGRHNSREGQITLGAAVLDDVLGVILLALLYDFTVSGAVNWANTAKVMIFVGSFFLLAPILARLMSSVIQHLDTRIDNPGLIPTTIVSLVLFFAWAAHEAGAPELLGGFAAGIALSRRFFLPFGLSMHAQPAFSHKIERQMLPIIQLFTPIFFVTVGLSLDLTTVDWSSPLFWYLSISLLAVAILAKFTGAMLLKEPLQRRLIIGIAMMPRGEVGLIFAGIGATAGVFDNDVYTALIVVIVYTTLLAPYLMKQRFRKAQHPIEA